MVLLVRTTLKKSSIDGVGLFADEDIKKGTLIWRYEPPVDQAYTYEHICGMHETLRAFMDKYAYLHNRTNMYILCGDNGRFVNHSENPNLHGFYPDNLEEGVDIAARDISSGEELTCDYRTFDLETASKLSYVK